ncbi:MAG: hypothetical protein J4F49_10705 [Rhodobacteraceae bacterium]|nr:hypothetical protein [Paracoccaceae bacterium]
MSKLVESSQDRPEGGCRPRKSLRNTAGGTRPAPRACLRRSQSRSLGARAQRSSPVGKAEVSEWAKAKVDTKRAGHDFPVHSFRTLLDDLSSVALNRVCIPGGTETGLAVATTPMQLQARAFELLDVNPGQFVPIRMAS